MKEHQQHMDKVFKEKLAAYSEQPPAGVWEGISGAISSTGRRKSLFIWLAAAAGLTALAGSILLINRESADEALMQKKVSEESSFELKEEAPAVQEKEVSDGINEPEESARQDAVAGLSPDEETENTNIQMADVTGEQDIAENNTIYFAELMPVDSRRSAGLPTGFDAGPASRPYLDDEKLRSGKPVIEESQGFDAEEILRSDRSDHWSFGTQAAPLYAYRNLETGSKESSVFTSDPGSLNNNESAILSYSGGINIQYHTNRRLSLQSGFYYSRMGMRLDFEGVAAKYEESVPTFGISEPVNSTGTLSYDMQTGSNTELATSWQEYNNQTPGTIDNAGGTRGTPSSWDLLQYLDYFEIPLVLKYKMIDRKIGLSLFSGISSQILVGNNVYLNDGEQREKIGETEELRNFNYSSILGVGLEYRLSHNWTINLEPSFKYYLNPVNTTGIYNSYPWNFGIYTGISYTIR